MPRQPLLERYHQGPWSMGASAREERPELILIIGQCLTYWPDIELFMALLLGVMLKANTDATVAVYLAITAGPARRAALKAAAAKLNGNYLPRSKSSIRASRLKETI